MADANSDGTVKETVIDYAGATKTSTVAGIKGWNGADTWLNAVTTYEEDALGRLVRVTSVVPTGVKAAQAIYTFSISDELTRVDLSQDGTTQTRSFQFDTLGRRQRTMNPESGVVEVLSFDPRGNPLVIQDERARSMGYALASSFDTAGRLYRQERVTTDGSAGQPDANLDGTALTLVAGAGWHLHTNGAQGSCGSVSSFSGATAWYFGTEATCAYDVLSTGTLQSVDITNVKKTTTLSFMYWRETRSTLGAGSSAVDRFDVLVSDDNFVHSSRVFSLGSDDKSWSDWKSSGPLSLGAFAGRTIKVRIVFDKVGGSSTIPKGILIDDVAIKTPTSLVLLENTFDDGNIVGHALSRGKLVLSKSFSEEPVYRNGAWTARETDRREFYYGGLNGRISQQSVSLDPDGNGSLETFDYTTIWDDYGTPQSMQYPAMAGEAARTYTYTYLNGALTNLRDWQKDLVSSVQYDLYGHPRQTVLGNGITDLETLDGMGRPVQINAIDSHGGTLMALGPYRYDGAGNVFAVGTEQFRYDGLNRLIHSELSGGVIVDTNLDAWGNITDSHTNETSHPPGVEFSNRKYSVAGSPPDNRVHDTGFSFDENGNITAEPSQSGGMTRAAYQYQWDSLNRMHGIYDPPSADGYRRPLEEFSYDMNGARSSKTRWDLGGEMTLYVRESSGNVLSEFKHNTAGTSTLSADYVYANGSLIAINALCGPPPSLSLDYPAWSNGYYHFVKTSANTPLSTDGYIIDIEGANHHTVTLPAGTADHFDIPASVLSPNSRNSLRIQTFAACGATGYSNAIVLSTVPPGGGGCLRSVAVMLDGEQTTSIRGEDVCAAPEIQYNFYFRADPSIGWNLLNDTPLTDASLQLTELPDKASMGEYQVRQVDAFGELEASDPLMVHSEDLIMPAAFAEAGFLPPPPPALTSRFLHLDHIGSTRLVTDTLGNVLSQHSYYPFGSERGASTSDHSSNGRLFTGHERDRESNLDYMRARYCANGPGRMMSADPEQANAETIRTQSWNGYAYVENNPLTYTDPSGLAVVLENNRQQMATRLSTGMSRKEKANIVLDPKTGNLSLRDATLTSTSPQYKYLAAAIKDDNTAHVWSVSAAMGTVTGATGYPVTEAFLHTKGGGFATAAPTPTGIDNGRDTDVFLAESPRAFSLQIGNLLVPPGKLPGLTSKFVDDPMYMIAFHEVCGESLQGQSSAGPTYPKSIPVFRENEIRRYMNLGQRSYLGH